jgi:hypothetical protein
MVISQHVPRSSLQDHAKRLSFVLDWTRQDAVILPITKAGTYHEIQE